MTQVAIVLILASLCALYICREDCKSFLSALASWVSGFFETLQPPVVSATRSYYHWLARDGLPVPRLLLVGVAMVALTMLCVRVEYQILIQTLPFVLPFTGARYLALLLVALAALTGCLFHFGSKLVKAMAFPLLATIVGVQAYLAMERERFIQQSGLELQAIGADGSPPEIDQIRVGLVCVVAVLPAFGEAIGSWGFFRNLAGPLASAVLALVGLPLVLISAVATLCRKLFATDLLSRVLIATFSLLVLPPSAAVALSRPDRGVGRWLIRWWATVRYALPGLARDQAETEKVIRKAERAKAASESRMELAELEFEETEQGRRHAHRASISEKARELEAGSAADLRDVFSKESRGPPARPRRPSLPA